MTEYPSIFNHVLSPITPGPSSSNTCGPSRISFLCRQILGGNPKEAIIEFSKDGAFPNTYIGMRSDLAFINGLLGRLQNDEGFTDAYTNAKAAGLSVQFQITDFQSVYMEAAKLTLKADNGNEAIIYAASTGGGTCLIYEIDGCPLVMRGDQYETLVFFEGNEQIDKEAFASTLQSHLEGVNEINFSAGQSKLLLEMKTSVKPEEAYIKELLPPNIIHMSIVSPIHPVIADIRRKPPFFSASEMVRYAEERNLSLWEAALEYEAALSGWSKEKILNCADELYGVIENSIKKGLEGKFNINGIVTPKAKKLSEYLEQKGPLSMGYLDYAIPVALGVMEFSNASGKILCLPTGGSSGIVPGILAGAGRAFNSSRQDLVKALLACGVIGVCMAEENNFSGGDYGCQAEVGCATAMAAGALVQLMNGTVRQGADAASMSLQCQLGLICDPVAGLVQVPCFARNMSCVSIAATSVAAVMGGFDVVIPFDEASKALVDLGKRLPADFRGCGGAGCCFTPTGKQLAKEQTQREERLRS